MILYLDFVVKITSHVQTFVLDLVSPLFWGFISRDYLRPNDLKLINYGKETYLKNKYGTTKNMLCAVNVA